jgi:hypothetical protein
MLMVCLKDASADVDADRPQTRESLHPQALAIVVVEEEVCVCFVSLT